MTPSSLGNVYMCMSAFQVLSNPIMGRLVDRIGKLPSITIGCSTISTCMMLLPVTAEHSSLALTLGTWTLASTILSTAPVAFLSDRFASSRHKPQAIALLRTLGDVGYFAGSLGIANVAQDVGKELAMTGTGAILLGCSLSWSYWNYIEK